MTLASKAGGFDSIFEAARAVDTSNDIVYNPIPENAAAYDLLFAEYQRLHDYFGRGENDVMKRLKAMRDNAK